MILQFPLHTFFLVLSFFCSLTYSHVKLSYSYITLLTHSSIHSLTRISPLLSIFLFSLLFCHLMQIFFFLFIFFLFRFIAIISNYKLIIHFKVHLIKLNLNVEEINMNLLPDRYSAHRFQHSEFLASFPKDVNYPIYLNKFDRAVEHNPCLY